MAFRSAADALGTTDTAAGQQVGARFTYGGDDDPTSTYTSGPVAVTYNASGPATYTGSDVLAATYGGDDQATYSYGG
jgi:hypothetical protein